jgi:hypothetical protein
MPVYPGWVLCRAYMMYLYKSIYMLSSFEEARIMHRTTFMLDEKLYRAVKRKAVDRGKPMRVLLEEALRAYLGLTDEREGKSKWPQFGVYDIEVKGDLRRETIYGE